MNIKALYSIIFLCLFSARAFACLGTAITLNDDTTITGDRISSDSGKDVTFAKDILGRTFDAINKKGVTTHVVLVLGQNRDERDIISTSYLVRDLVTGVERVYLLKTHYMGDGTYSRGNGSPETQANKDPQFKTLLTAGCAVQ